MKTLSFTCKPNDRIYLEQVLPALLDRNKGSSIRPLWKEVKVIDKLNLESVGMTRDMKNLQVQGTIEKSHKEFIYKKPCRKVGEQVQIMWKQRSSPKGSWFCSKCGKQIECYKSKDMTKFSYLFKCEHSKYRQMFPKILGTVEITEVFETWIEDVGREFLITQINPQRNRCLDNKEIALKDGFRSAEDMFSWFNKEYDLSQPRRFAVYRWRWIDGRKS